MRRNPFIRFVGACLQAMIDFVGARSLATRTDREPARFHKRAPRLLTMGPVLALLPIAVAAQTVRWDPPGGQLGFNQTSQLTLVFEDCEPDGNPELPRIEGLQHGRPSVSQQSSFSFGSGGRGSSSTYSLIYPVRPERRTPITIPAFEVKTDKGVLKVPAARYTVGDAPVGNSSLTVADVATATLETPKQSLWAGEVFSLSYTLNVARRYYHSLGSNIEWQGAPALADDWTKPEPREAIVQGDRRVVSVQTTRALVKQPGNYALRPASQLVNLVVGSSGFGFFTQPNIEQRQLDTNPLEIAVRALPPAPADFSGAVGQFTFTSKVVPVTGAVGEPITWTIELAGAGNWPDIAGLPQREVSNDFQVVQPKSKRTIKEGTLFEGTLTEDVVLVPTRPGTYRLPPVRFSYFDPASGTYKTIATEPVAVTVTAASTTAPAAVPPGAPVQFSLTPAAPAAAPALPAAVAPVAPENLPRDPLFGKATGFAPRPLRQLVWTCVLAASVVPLLLWFVLAGLRARASDPQRHRRAAHAALRQALAELRSAKPSPAALRAWQRHTAALWEIPHAAPGAPLVHASVGRQSLDGTTWATLWSEVDRSLHGPDASLPADWVPRAESAVQAVKVPGWNPLTVIAGRHLLPFLFSVALVAGLTAPMDVRADAEAYKRGDFATAEKHWQAAATAAPTDWITRHNLGLALAQQDRWAEATGHWASAFLLHPRSETTHWDLNLGLQRSGLAPQILVELARGEGRFKLVRAASPGEWQLVLIGAASLFALALTLLLLQGYQRIGGWGKPTALTASLLAVVLAAAATYSLHAYGPVASPEAVIVSSPTTLWSIPTEADSTQKLSPLSAGSVATADATFLDWTRLNFAGGQTGWVRTRDVIHLYR